MQGSGGGSDEKWAPEADWVPMPAASPPTCAHVGHSFSVPQLPLPERGVTMAPRLLSRAARETRAPCPAPWEAVSGFRGVPEAPAPSPNTSPSPGENSCKC